MFKKKKHPVNDWIDRVISGKEVAGKLIRLAVQRHVTDFERADERGIYFDPEVAQMWIDFFPLLRHWKGPLRGKPLFIDPWQQFVIASIFGWKREGGFRRFREAYNQIARGNGKTTLCGGIALGGLTIEEEGGAQIYSYATKKDQARLVWRDSQKMLINSPDIAEVLTPFATSIVNPENDSGFYFLGSDSDTQDGLHVSFGIGDELHAHPDREMYDVIDTATGKGPNGLMVSISTAGFNSLSFCKLSLRDYAEKILTGEFYDDRFFGFVAEPDDGDDWRDEKIWKKANLSLPSFPDLDDMRAKFQKAKVDGGAENNFKCKHLNIWVNQASRWIPAELWNNGNGAVDVGSLRGKPCYSALDLSTTIDMSCIVHVFRMDGEFKVLPRFFIPGERIDELAKRSRVPLRRWVDEGFIHATNGDAISYQEIFQILDQDAQQFDILQLAFDRWGATQMIQALEERGLSVVEFPQTFGGFSPPSKQLIDLLHQKRIHHAANPVLKWHAGNVCVEMDAAGNIRPSKRKSPQKIDGIVTLIMALDRAIRKEGSGKSVYDSRGLLSV